MKEMPYDSSKVKFHDKLDMFFRMKSVERPGGPRPKTAGGKASTKESGNKMNEFINAYEQRKKDLSARRFQMLFLKRLENDGCKISISKQDRDLLRNFGKVEEEQAVKELQKAIIADSAPYGGVADVDRPREGDAKEESANLDFSKDSKLNPESALEQLQV